MPFARELVLVVGEPITTGSARDRWSELHGRLHERLRRLVLRYRPRLRGNPWCGPEDWEAEAWEAVCRAVYRYPDLTGSDLDKVSMVAARNALSNLRQKLAVWLRVGSVSADSMERLPYPHDRFGLVVTRILATQLCSSLKPALHQLYVLIIDTWVGGEFPMSTVKLAERACVCPDTARSRLVELRRVARRELAV